MQKTIRKLKIDVENKATKTQEHKRGLKTNHQFEKFTMLVGVLGAKMGETEGLPDNLRPTLS